MENRKCNKCDSNKIIDKVNITDVGHYNEKHNLSIQIQTTNRVLFNRSVKSSLLATVCCNCRNVELSIDNPNELWDAYIQKQKNNQL
ncbi:hypothetical protein WH52_06420 [Tenacibaculum holothuriorum]|uniref:Uncharacterized protein n=1 Tax=Tenacibaculum holothuriorum TaxID=1635173 RepID=A0A1Y2PDZ8_9FLAO|nr:hypothetical protein [Tenacibaculum holothuriorum]OSY88390.1 hypothetical protein WH52_06420 [Tenacibaculum holothuriorum]